MNDSKMVKRYQWMRNAEGGQSFGNHMEIRPLAEEFFIQYVYPRLRPGFAKNLSEYQSKFPHVTHYAAVWRDGDTDWQFIGVGSLEELELEPHRSKWAIKVKNFNLPVATSFGKTADSDLINV